MRGLGAFMLPANSVEVKISFKKHWGPNGTVYGKSFRITKKILEAFKLALAAEAAMEKNHERQFWLNRVISSEKKSHYLNLTQADYFVIWASRQNEIRMNQKRAKYNHNARLIVD